VRTLKVVSGRNMARRGEAVAEEKGNKIFRTEVSTTQAVIGRQTELWPLSDASRREKRRNKSSYKGAGQKKKPSKAIRGGNKLTGKAPSGHYLHHTSLSLKFSPNRVRKRRFLEEFA